jgi:hypothetical protein
MVLHETAPMLDAALSSGTLLNTAPMLDAALSSGIEKTI